MYSDTRCAPHQVLKEQEWNKLTELHKETNQWAVEQLVNPANTSRAEAISRQVKKNSKFKFSEIPFKR